MDHEQGQQLKTYAITLWGIVQGVGFRPFVAKMAAQHGITGTVLNQGGNVTIVASGSEEQLQSFINDIQAKKPAPAAIVHWEVKDLPYAAYADFSIAHSSEGDQDLVMLPADLAICSHCAEELFDPEDPRYLHPFISCMECGPRYSIIDRVPYDRQHTSMAEFPMCDYCQDQYTALQNRRYHAQTISCHECGPYLIYRDSQGRETIREQALNQAISTLQQGGIAAIKGIGGFHLACSPFDQTAVSNLRMLKGREEKPFAVMFSSVDEIKQYCEANEAEAAILQQSARPIVLLKRKPSAISPAVYRSSRYLGAFLPYTPMQLLILRATGPLIMTSANLSDRPMIKDDQEILSLTSPLLAGVLYHDRQIRTRIDDSVVKLVAGDQQMIRRARGHAPVPVYLPGMEVDPQIQVLATGGQLKNTFCLTKGSFAYLSQYMGDISDSQSLGIYRETIDRMQVMFRIKPQAVCCDLHPNYLTTRVAQELGLELITVQHHHAHIASVMAEQGIQSQVIGVAFDGTGYGTDGAIWGGEFLLCAPDSWQRVGHLQYVSLLGGDSSVKEAWKTAYMYLYAAGLEATIEDSRWPLIKAAVQHNINTIASSSMGRLFDAVSALLGIAQYADYEGECAIKLENAAAEYLEAGGDSDTEVFPFAVTETDGARQLDFTETIESLFASNQPDRVNELAYRFHLTVAVAVARMCEAIRGDFGVNAVALGGGVFQNSILLERTIQLLRAQDFRVYWNKQVPPNDGGISLGQAWVGINRLKAGQVK